MPLQSFPLTAFLATTRPDEARRFYCDVLGLPLQDDSPFALVVAAPNAPIRIQKVPAFTPAPFTVLGWSVPDLPAKIHQLTAKGIHFERFPGLPQNDQAIWLSPSGAKVAWFKDPDGNILSLTQFA
jgi:catechol 2,3-dioxygenase-like lactoylglutathione lyase family enzyme